LKTSLLSDRLSEIEEDLRDMESRRSDLQAERDKLLAALEDSRSAKVAKNIEALLDCAEEHSYTSCSDNDPRNWRGSRCARCCLLGVQSGALVGVTIKIEAVVPGEQ
jgi:hypothetical protein